MRARPRPAAPPPPQQGQQQQRQGGFVVFVDDDLQTRSRLDDDTGDVDDWPDFGTLRERVKENTKAPAPWTESALDTKKKPSASAAVPGGGGAPAFAFFVDDDLDAPPEDARLPDHLDTLRIRD